MENNIDADRRTAEAIVTYGDSALRLLFDAILNAKLPTQDYSMGEMRELNGVKSLIKENRVKERKIN